MINKRNIYVKEWIRKTKYILIIFDQLIQTKMVFTKLVEPIPLGRDSLCESDQYMVLLIDLGQKNNLNTK